MSKELRECPFCGKNKARVKKRETGFYCVTCAYCAAETGATYTAPESISAWNRRTTRPAAGEERR